MSDQTDDADDDVGAKSRTRSSRKKSDGKLSRELLHGLTPEEFREEAHSLADAEAMTPAVRERMKAHLVERLMTPVDRPSWGPDWVRQSDRETPRRTRKKPSGMFGFAKRDRETFNAEREPESEDNGLKGLDRNEAHVIARNLETSRQVWHYRDLYLIAALLAISIALLGMFVDYQIIRGDVWTRALSNEFMVVPASLESSVVFKSLQVVFAVLIVHFMLKITGVYGRNAMIATAFVLSILMIGSLGYLVAYNNMAGATSATLEHHDDGSTPQDNSISKLFASANTPGNASPSDAVANSGSGDKTVNAGMMNADESSLRVPQISQRTLANFDSWDWLAFASVIFFIVTTVAALFLLTTENNIRNFVIAHDYQHRKRMFAQLHLLELADQRQQQSGRAA